MAIPESAQFQGGESVRRFFMRLLGERFSGFVDFDFATKKRRVFFDEGKPFSAQSSVPGESLTDLLVTRRLLRAEDKAVILQVARDKKLPLELAAIDSGKVSEKDAVDTLRALVELLITQSVSEESGSYKLTSKPGLRTRMKGELVDTLALLARDEISDVALDPQVAKARQEIREAFEKQKTQGHYEVLGVGEKASADEIKKKYFDLAKLWHTDRYGKLDLGEEAKLQLESLFGKVSDAFNTLSDPQKRSDYDAIMDRKKKGLPTDVSEIMRAESAFKRGDALLTRGEFQGALKELTLAKEINPGEAEFWAMYGLALYSAEHKAVEAIAAVHKAIEIQPQLARAFECLGRIHKAEGENQKARNNFQKCLELDPKNINAQRELRLMAMRADSGKHQPVKNGGGGIFSKLFKK